MPDMKQIFEQEGTIHNGHFILKKLFFLLVEREASPGRDSEQEAHLLP